MMAAQVPGDPGKAVFSVLAMVVVSVVACVLAGVVPLGFKTGMIAATAIAICKCLWPLQSDVDALLAYDPNKPDNPD